MFENDPKFPKPPKLWVLSCITRQNEWLLARRVTQQQEPRSSSQELTPKPPKNPHFDPNCPKIDTQTLLTVNLF